MNGKVDIFMLNFTMFSCLFEIKISRAGTLSACLLSTQYTSKLNWIHLSVNHILSTFCLSAWVHTHSDCLLIGRDAITMSCSKEKYHRNLGENIEVNICVYHMIDMSTLCIWRIKMKQQTKAIKFLSDTYLHIYIYMLCIWKNCQKIFSITVKGKS